MCPLLHELFECLVPMLGCAGVVLHSQCSVVEIPEQASQMQSTPEHKNCCHSCLLQDIGHTNKTVIQISLCHHAVQIVLKKRFEVNRGPCGFSVLYC